MPTIDLGIKYSDAQDVAFFGNVDAKFKVYPKGRRAGFTQGAAQAFIEWMIEGISPLLWGDTIHANIDRYVDRYFVPILRQLPPTNWGWSQQRKLLRVNDSVCDFRSADKPENWEGFAYQKIFLNEAGIILKDRSLYENTVLPMLIDFPHTQLIAAGTPKGASGVFFELWNRAKERPDRYHAQTFSTFCNPFLSKNDLAELIEEMPQSVYRQEILGEFVDPAGARIKREWLKYGIWHIDCGWPVFFGVDLALGLKETSDWTAIAVVGMPPDGSVVVLDVQRVRVPFNGVLQFIKQMAAKWKPQRIGVEAVQYQAAVVQELLRTTKLPVVGVHPDKDKLTRFLPLEARYEQGLVKHVQGLPSAFEDELLSFPEGEFDDQCDALVYAWLQAKSGGARLPEGTADSQKSETIMGGVRSMEF